MKPSETATTSLFPAEQLDYWTQIYASEQVEDNSTQLEYLLFSLGQEHFAILMDDLDEVVTLTSGMALPHTSSLIIGLSNVRSDVIVLINLIMKTTFTQRSNLNRITLPTMIL